MKAWAKWCSGGKEGTIGEGTDLAFKVIFNLWSCIPATDLLLHPEDQNLFFSKISWTVREGCATQAMKML